MSQTKLQYLLLDSAGDPVAKGILESPPGWEVLQCRVLENKISEVLDHELLQLVSISESAPNLLGRIDGHRGDVLTLTKLKALGPEARRNLRIPVAFSSFLYPLTGKWKGRRKIESIDLSCGGVAFFCEEPLELEEVMEVVIPITVEPLILQGKLLRRWEIPPHKEPAYAVKFVHTCHDEEVLLREAVFGIQLENRDARTRGNH